MSENYSHQNDLFDQRCVQPVFVIGAGSIGSVVILALVKMGFHDIVVMDADVVDSHNAPMSLYQGKHTGRLKVDVLQEVIEYMTGVTIKTVSEFYTDQTIKQSIIIACVDTMNARSNIWKKVKGEFRINLFIDTRTSAAYSEVYAVSPRLTEEQEQYEGFLFPDSEAARQMCGSHGVIFVPFHVASAVTSTIARFLHTGQKIFCHSVKCDTLETITL